MPLLHRKQTVVGPRKPCFVWWDVLPLCKFLYIFYYMVSGMHSDIGIWNNLPKILKLTRKYVIIWYIMIDPERLSETCAYASLNITCTENNIIVYNAFLFLFCFLRKRNTTHTLLIKLLRLFYLATDDHVKCQSI